MSEQKKSKKYSVTNIAGYSVRFNALKPTHFVKIDVTKFGLLDHLAVEPSFELHHQQEHLIIRSPWEENLARVQLVQSAANRPYIQ